MLFSVVSGQSKKYNKYKNYFTFFNKKLSSHMYALYTGISNLLSGHPGLNHMATLKL